MTPIALYIHWPFCKKKCPYCDFNSHVRDNVDHVAWKNALLSELRHMHSLAPHHSLSSIFFGGGTPSLMKPDTARALIDEATNLWPATPDIEITLEANPTSVESQTFPDFKMAGVNRVSLGIQSLRPESLTFLGREHSADEALRALDHARTHFPRHNFDLIYALPEQSLAGWETELREALAFAGDHLSLYQLTIEPNTMFHHAYHVKKSFQLPPDTIAADMYSLTQSIMQSHGMPAYEISNHARPGQASRHNLTYWTGGAYIGIGPGAHGRIHNGEWHATLTHKTPELWLDKVASAGHGIESHLPLTHDERLEERLMTGLRLTEGLALNTLTDSEHALLASRISQRTLDTLTKENLLEITPTHWRTTDKGKLLLNSILVQLLA